MKYNFDEMISRRNTNCIKWDASADSEMLPMWVADMDFRTAPAIVEALQKRVAHGIFGYTRVPDEYYQAVISWLDRRHGLKTKKGLVHLYFGGGSGYFGNYQGYD